MKKAILFSLLIAFSQVSAFSQHIYLKGQVGYDLGFLKSQYTYASNDIVADLNNTVVTSSYETYKCSFGTGASFNLGAGIMISKFISAELTGFYTLCREQKFNTVDQLTDEGGYNFTFYNTVTQGGTFYGIKPAFTFTLPGNDLRPYTRVGAILSMTSIRESTDVSVITDHPNYIPFDDMESTLEYKKQFTAGANLALGLEYMFLEKFWVFGEVEANIATYIPSSASYTEYILSGQDYLDDLTTSEREIAFTESYSDEDNSSADEPTMAPPVRFSFSSVGINIGLKYTLFK